MQFNTPLMLSDRYYSCARIVDGMRYGKRAKHLTELFPQEWLDDLGQTYVQVRIRWRQVCWWIHSLRICCVG